MPSSSHIVPAGAQREESFYCSGVGSLPQEIDSCWRSPWRTILQATTPQTAATWVTLPALFPHRCSPSGTACSNMGPPYNHKSWQETFPQICRSLPGASSSISPHRVTASSGIHLLWRRCGSPSCGTGGSLHPCGPPWTAEKAQLWCLENLLPFLLH